MHLKLNESDWLCCDGIPVTMTCVSVSWWVGVFITAGPSTKLFAWGGGELEDMCYERLLAEACAKIRLFILELNWSEKDL